jgi:hypothetical protein
MLGKEEEAKAMVKRLLDAHPTFTVDRFIKGLPARPEDIKPYVDALYKAPFPK